MLKKRITYLQRLLGVIIAFLWIALMPFQSFGQALNKITGKVIDGQTKESLLGVSVKIKGTSKGVSTDNKGQFTITAKDNDILVFSHIGYDNQEVNTKGKTSIDILLAPAAADLNNVVVSVGYGSTRKKDLTGSVGQANVGDMAKAPVASFDQALAGRMAGVQVSSSDGQPGAEGISIVVRGANSLTQSNAPLYVIDGFPIVSPDNGALNPNDIASITVLKDASATAIYGSRGANGVIIIETKKGKNGAPIVSYNGSYGGQKVVKKMDMMSAYDFVKYQNELNPTSTATTYFGNGKTLILIKM